MLWTLLSAISRLVWDVNTDYFWTGWLLKNVVPVSPSSKWTHLWDSKVPSVESIAMGLLRSLELICRLGLTTSPSNSIATLAPRALYHKRQLISVDSIRPTANQTALAIQSTIGLNAAGILLNNSTYSRVAADYVNTLYYGGLGLDGTSPADSTHFTYNYDGNQTWNVLFTSYPDVLLDLNTFPQAAWDLQSDWYLRQMQEGGLAFAGPVDDLHYTGRPLNWGLTDWNILAASVSSHEVQQQIIDTTHAFMTNGQNSIPFGTKYIVQGPRMGRWIGNLNRASVGCHFALLALDQGPWYTSAVSR